MTYKGNLGLMIALIVLIVLIALIAFAFSARVSLL